MSKNVIANCSTSLVVTTGHDVSPAWDYEDSIRINEQAPGLVKLKDISAPMDKPTTIKIAVSPINNVYTTLAKGKVPVSRQDANVQGTDVFIEVNTMLNVTWTEGSINYATISPVRARLTISCQDDTDISDAALSTALDMLVATLCDGEGDIRFGEIQRGCIVPKEL